MKVDWRPLIHELRSAAATAGVNLPPYPNDDGAWHACHADGAASAGAYLLLENYPIALFGKRAGVVPPETWVLDKWRPGSRTVEERAAMRVADVLKAFPSVRVNGRSARAENAKVPLRPRARHTEVALRCPEVTRRVYETSAPLADHPADRPDVTLTPPMQPVGARNSKNGARVTDYAKVAPRVEHGEVGMRVAKDGEVTGRVAELRAPVTAGRGDIGGKVAAKNADSAASDFLKRNPSNLKWRDEVETPEPPPMALSDKSSHVSSPKNGKVTVSLRTSPSPASPSPPSSSGSPRQAASNLLSSILASGPVSTNDVRTNAARAGISWGSIRRAAAALGIESVREGYGGGGHWSWQLPAREANSRTRAVAKSAISNQE